jgi:hypothetical protein
MNALHLNPPTPHAGMLINNAIEAYVAAAHTRSDALGIAQGCTFAELYDVFGDPGSKAQGGTLAPFRKRMNWLVYCGRLGSTGRGMERWFSPATTDAAPERREPAEPAESVTSVDTWVATRTPPQQYDRMTGPTYVPEAGPVLRPGAMTFKTLPSCGYAC